jgi:hypothetical protein
MNPEEVSPIDSKFSFDFKGKGAQPTVTEDNGFADWNFGTKEDAWTIPGEQGFEKKEMEFEMKFDEFHPDEFTEGKPQEVLGKVTKPEPVVVESPKKEEPKIDKKLIFGGLTMNPSIVGVPSEIPVLIFELFQAVSDQTVFLQLLTPALGKVVKSARALLPESRFQEGIGFIDLILDGVRQVK